MAGFVLTCLAGLVLLTWFALLLLLVTLRVLQCVFDS